MIIETLIIAALIKALGDRYKVISSYDGSEDIALSGVIAVNITDI